MLNGQKKPQTRVEFALDYITKEIASGNLRAGDKLPNEKDLAEQLGISRTPIREAMKTLAVAGLIDIRHGHGSYVREEKGAPALPLNLFQLYLQDSTPEMLMELRDIFDRNCSELAAQRRTDEDLARMRECIDRLKALTEQPDASLDDMLQADLDFHRAIYEATGNKLIMTVAEFVLNMVAPWVRKSLDVSGRVRAVDLHEQIYDAILKREIGPQNRMSVDANMKHFMQSLDQE
ncbi:FadR/GntR family transcriptional regulator [Sinorhizobium fredii]|uniref:GntR family transcriptional regulator protein n=1 Tax=Rhizobium fredii TaxID=380 RepID=A0A2L0HD63_RHIFR|nr:FadR/GntR family transcriptional regulator [Sinorhizobium fredii]AUX79433.1 GntR family transcriptional regulator protein [Sinorhizobium fredii]